MTHTKYLRDYLRALVRALWSGFGITDTLVVVLIVIIFIASSLQHAHFEEHPPAWLIATLAAATVLFEVLRTAYQLYAFERKRREQLEEQPNPQLTHEQPNVASTYMWVPNKPGIPSRYVRLPIRNTSRETANRCSAKLVKIEFQNSIASDRGGWRTLAYNDTLDMAWSNKPRDNSREVELGPNCVDTLDVAYVVDGSRELRIASVMPASYPNLMGLAGDYRFSLQVTSANVGTRVLKLQVHWDFNNLVFPDDPVQSI